METLEEAMILQKIPSGISSLDIAIKGGFPSGSVILLLGEGGSGNFELAYTSAVMLSRLMSDSEYYATVKRQMENISGGEKLKIPDKVCYISLARSRKDILQEMYRIFSSEYLSTFQKLVIFKDLSPIYYRSSITPLSWVSDDKTKDWFKIAVGWKKSEVENEEQQTEQQCKQPQQSASSLYRRAGGRTGLL